MNKVQNDKQLEATSSNPIFLGLEKVKAELANLQKIQESVYKTNGSVAGFSRKVQDETDIPTLIKMYSSVRGKKEAYDAAAEELGLKRYPVFKLEGGTKEEWKADIELRINILNTKQRYDKLTGIKKKLEDLMGKEEKLAIVMKELEDFGAGETEA